MAYCKCEVVLSWPGPELRRRPYNIEIENATILIVDDEDAVLKIVGAILESAGYHVVKASNYDEAMALCLSGITIHLAIIDVIMPGMNGPALRECLRELVPSMRVLYMSGYTYDQLASEGIQGMPEDFLSKPFTMASLLRRVQEALAQAQHGANP